MGRKDFLQKFAIGSSLLFTAPVLFNSCSDSNDDVIDDAKNTNDDKGIKMDLSNNNFSALTTVGGFAYTGDIIVIRSGENSFIALSKVCTHEGCTITSIMQTASCHVLVTAPYFRLRV
ncbi:MAG TPA: hypothetical protein ENN90_02385 [Mariniphaga anaerophila]|uniref:Rieske [2Fe-2S] domain-containing protein n=1 Tax=Mariniphaga anaerophila TaxID=1484053 RepID=A0A831LFU5_9BACT|nr:hypothetical protein [Mariniphaga anaerophila]